MRPISPSEIAVRGAGMNPSGIVKAQHAGHCAMCGFAHNEGEMVTPFKPEGSFTDASNLREKASKFICGWCTTAWGVEFTQKALKTVMCAEGVFPAASNAHIAYWLRNPPTGPWIWVMGDQKRQHIVWRATVNTGQDIFQIKFGELNLTVRRKHLEKAEESAKRLAATASMGRKGAALKSPFVRLSRDLDTPAHGQIRADLHRMANDNPDVAANIEILQSCTTGELWALTAVLYAEPPAERPQPYFT